MSLLEGEFGFVPRAPMTEDEIFSAWLTFNHDCTLDEFREALVSLGSAKR